MYLAPLFRRTAVLFSLLFFPSNYTPFALALALAWAGLLAHARIPLKPPPLPSLFLDTHIQHRCMQMQVRPATHTYSTAQHSTAHIHCCTYTV